MGWEGRIACYTQYVTPMQYVLEDIKEVHGANEVKMVVRKDDETDNIFGRPEV